MANSLLGYEQQFRHQLVNTLLNVRENDVDKIIEEAAKLEEYIKEGKKNA